MTLLLCVNQRNNTNIMLKVNVFGEPQNISDVIRPFINFLKLFGLFAISYDSSSSFENFKFKWYDAVYVVAVFGGHMFAFHKEVLMLRSFVLIKNFGMYTFIVGFMSLISVVSIAICTAFQASKSKKIFKFLEILKSFDTEVNF